MTISQHSKKDISSLEWHEQMRLRPGMYLGAANEWGFVNLIKGMISEFFTKYDGIHFSIDLLEDLNGVIKIRTSEAFLSNQLANFFNFKETYNLELCCLNAFSDFLEFRLYDDKDKDSFYQIYHKGVLKEGLAEHKEFYGKLLKIHFKLDKTIWVNEFQWREDYLLQELRNYAYLFGKKNVEVNYQKANEACRAIFQYPNGLWDLIEFKIWRIYGQTYFNTHLVIQIEGLWVEAAYGFLSYSVDQAYQISFANDHQTIEHSTHLEGLFKGITVGVMKYFQKHKLTNQYKISEKGMKENLLAAINVRMENPRFSGCVKNKLANSEIIEPIANLVAENLFEKIEQEDEMTQKLIRKFEI